MARLTFAPSRALIGAIAVSFGLLVLRLDLARRVGFGDAEALYVAYALYPQPAYLDHPGLVGLVARWLGGGSLPSAWTTHAFTTVAATLLPWAGVLASRATGAAWDGAWRSYFALALMPELSIGLFALTPDLLLAHAWLAALASGAWLLGSEPGSRKALFAALGAGAAVGFACLGKVTGLLLGLALLVALAGRGARGHLRTAAPWCGLLLGLVLAAPVALWEWREGFPMLTHRLVRTQTESGLSFRNLGALIGGQLLYVTPPFLLGGFRALRWLHERRDAPVARLLWVSAVLPGCVLIALCLWSRTAEPHWLAPAYLSLCLAAGHTPRPSPALARSALATGGVAVALGWLWVGTDLPPRFLGDWYVGRYDLSNDLHAWKVGRRVLGSAVADVHARTGRIPVVTGPHYIVCAQALVALKGAVAVGCRTPAGDDFARWLPPRRWMGVRSILYVSDDRFTVDPRAEFPDRDVVDVRRAELVRGGRTVRTITVTRLDRTNEFANTR